MGCVSGISALQQATGAIPQFRDDFKVGAPKGKPIQFIQPRPAPVSTAKRLRRPFKIAALKRMECDPRMGKGVPDNHKQIAHHDSDRQFFHQFAGQTFRQRFAGFLFAAGEFPQSTEQAAMRTLRNQQLSGIIPDDARRDVKMWDVGPCGFDRALILYTALKR